MHEPSCGSVMVFLLFSIKLLDAVALVGVFTGEAAVLGVLGALLNGGNGADLAVVDRIHGLVDCGVASS